MALLSKQDESYGFNPRSFAFWRNNAVYFCLFSVLGHWMEIPYCMFMDQFGIVDPDSLVWDDPMYPFCVYGVAVVVCALLLVPLKNLIVRRRATLGQAGVEFYCIAVVICMLMELGMGLLLNQPLSDGSYPLWDNSDLPGNILGQAWIVNDVLLGGVAMLYTWVVYPLMQKALANVPRRPMNVAAAVIVVGFIILCAEKFS